MVYHLVIKPAAEKGLKKFPNADYYRILSALAAIRRNPFAGKKLKGVYKNQYTYRVWPYRIIYQILKKELLILVIRIGQRQTIYH